MPAPATIHVEGHVFCGGFVIPAEALNTQGDKEKQAKNKEKAAKVKTQPAPADDVDEEPADLLLPLTLGRRFQHFLIRWFLSQGSDPTAADHVSISQDPAFLNDEKITRLFSVRREGDVEMKGDAGKLPCLRVSGKGRPASILIPDSQKSTDPRRQPGRGPVSCDVLVHWLGESSLRLETRPFKAAKTCNTYVQLGLTPPCHDPDNQKVSVQDTHIIITSVSELSSLFRIRRRSSYEAMAVDILRQLRGQKKDPAPVRLPDHILQDLLGEVPEDADAASLLPLLFCRAEPARERVVIIRVNHSATLVYRQVGEASKPDAEDAWLLYYARHPSPLTTFGSGRMEGYNGLSGGLIAAAARSPQPQGPDGRPWYLAPIKEGLRWQEAHWQQGFYQVLFADATLPESSIKVRRRRITSDWKEPGFCDQHLATLQKRVDEDKTPVLAPKIDIMDAVAPRGAWFIAKKELQDRAEKARKDLSEDERAKLAENPAQTLICGAVEMALPWLTDNRAARDDIPVASVGKKLHIIDRREVEDLLFLQDAFRNYTTASPPPPRPLNLAVFGPPGAGKSFGVTELCAFMSSLPIHMGRPLAKDPLTYNLSQLQAVPDLIAALHQVRSKCLEGSIPIVFMDEFDSTFENKPFGWLKYFLAPMQDGKFSDGSATYTLGQCVLVFAGGINRTFEEFNGRSRNPAFVEAKGPDFISRLRGHLNIRGINKAPEDEDGGRYILRRAMFLQSMLMRYHGADLMPAHPMEANLARAFLEIDFFKHGARSMEAILDMSSKRKGETYRASDLPPRSQMDMHLDSARFFDRLLEQHPAEKDC